MITYLNLHLYLHLYLYLCIYIPFKGALERDANAENPLEPGTGGCDPRAAQLAAPRAGLLTRSLAEGSELAGVRVL